MPSPFVIVHSDRPALVFRAVPPCAGDQTMPLALTLTGNPLTYFSPLGLLFRPLSIRVGCIPFSPSSFRVSLSRSRSFYTPVLEPNICRFLLSRHRRGTELRSLLEPSKSHHANSTSHDQPKIKSCTRRREVPMVPKHYQYCVGFDVDEGEGGAGAGEAVLSG